MGSGVKPDAIYVFLGHDLPVSIRHRLQSEIKDKYRVHLEILDAQAVSAFLCDPEHFWIAEKYLDISRALRPQRKPEEIEDWYKSALDHWTDEQEFFANPANFYELSSAIRHATYTRDVVSDVPFWIQHLENFREHEGCPEMLARRATYEIAVAALRGLGTLHGREEEVRAYFSGINELTTSTDLEDAVVLLTFCRGAFQHDAIQLGAVEIDNLCASMLDQLDARLELAETATTRCMLLDLGGYAALMFAAPVAKPEVPDFTIALRNWNKMLDLVSGAPMYPLERFADRLTEWVRIVGDVDGLHELTSRVDELLSARFGGFIAASKCRDRALQFYERGDVLRGIRELHYAKIAWFADETLRGAILAMLLLSDWYREIGLTFAAKQYALAVAFIAVDTVRTDLKRFLPKALLGVADCEYIQGNWCEFMGRIGSTLWSHHLVPNQDRLEAAVEDELRRILYHSSIVLMVAEQIAPEIYPDVKAHMDSWGLDEWFDEWMPMAREAWGNQDVDTMWSKFQEQFAGRPFADIPDPRTTTWRQLGLLWEVTYASSVHTVARAEQFIAAAQVVMAEWAGMDLCLLPTTVRVSVRVVDDSDDVDLSAQPSNDGRTWVLSLPAERTKKDVNDFSFDAAVQVITILSEVSVLPQKAFHDRMESLFKAGLPAKVMVARPYDELYRSLTMEPRPFEKERTEWNLPESDREFVPHEYPEMGWYQGPGPGYTQESAEEVIRNRYERGIRPVRITIKRLWKDKDFREMIKHLKADGWLDWHILLAITSIVLDHRVFQPLWRKGESPSAIDRVMNETIDRDETFDDRWVLNSAFSEEAMRRALMASQLSTLKNEGLECRQRTPDIGAIDDFLRHRYNYWIDDVEHADLFND